MKRNNTPKEGQDGSRGAVGEGKRFLAPRQLADRWDCSPATAQRIAKNAGIAKYCLGEGRNGTVRYLLSEIEAYEEQRRVPGVP